MREILDIYLERTAIVFVIRRRFVREKQSNSKKFPFNCGKFETEIIDVLFLLELSKGFIKLLSWSNLDINMVKF